MGDQDRQHRAVINHTQSNDTHNAANRQGRWESMQSKISRRAELTKTEQVEQNPILINMIQRACLLVLDWLRNHRVEQFCISCFGKDVFSHGQGKEE